MTAQDLLLVRRGNVLQPFIPSQTLSKVLRDGEDVLQGKNYFKNFGACCEWMEVTDLTDSLVGVCLVDFYELPGHETVEGLRAENVIWDAGGEAIVLLEPAKVWKIQPGPYLPVSFLKGSLDEKWYFIYEGLPGNRVGMDLFQVMDAMA